MTDLETLVREVRADPARRAELLHLLHEGHPAYDGRGESAALRMRGWVLATYETVGLPPEAVPAVLEVLHTAVDAFSVAAAARAARGAIAADPELPRALVSALTRLRGLDDTVSFAALRPQWPDPQSTTALIEVLRSLEGFGPTAHGVHGDLLEARRLHASTWSPATRKALDAAIEATARAPLSLIEPTTSANVPSIPPGVGEVGAVELEDQDGALTTFGEHFGGRRNVVAFFYTRCGNPAKCSATVTRLADLATRLPAALPEKIGVAGISYDPGYDTAERLAAYGAARGLPFGDSVRLFRSPTGHAVLRAHFDLKVGYAGSLVNQHGVELYLVGADTRTERTWSRVTWTVDEVLAVLSS